MCSSVDPGDTVVLQRQAGAAPAHHRVGTRSRGIGDVLFAQKVAFNAMTGRRDVSNGKKLPCHELYGLRGTMAKLFSLLIMHWADVLQLRRVVSRTHR